jgi:cell division protein FtsL
MLIRVANFLCVALLGLVVLANYHVSEKTRLARVELDSVEHKIALEKTNMAVLQAEWQKVADPARIQMLAQSRLGMGDTASLQLSSLELLPHRGDEAPVGGSEVRQASVQVPESQTASLTPVSDTRQ